VGVLPREKVVPCGRDTRLILENTLHPEGWTSVVQLSSQFEINYLAEMCSGSEAGSYLRLVDVCITQL